MSDDRSVKQLSVRLGQLLSQIESSRQERQTAFGQLKKLICEELDLPAILGPRAIEVWEGEIRLYTYRDWAEAYFLVTPVDGISYVNRDDQAQPPVRIETAT